MPHKHAKSSVRQQQRKERGHNLVPTAKDSITNEAIPKSAQRILNALQIREGYKKRKAQGGGNGHGGGGGGGKKRKTGAGTGEQLKIMPGESIQHFNRRVEDDLRPLVKTAMDSGRAVMRKALREEIEEKKNKKKGKAAASSSTADPSPSTDKGKAKAANPESDAEDDSKPSKSSKKQHSKDTSAEAPTKGKHADKPIKDFTRASTLSSAPKRLNDIAMAPPELQKIVSSNKKGASATSQQFKLGKVTSDEGKEGVVTMAQRVMMEKERENAIRRYREMKARNAAAANAEKGIRDD